MSEESLELREKTTMEEEWVAAHALEDAIERACRHMMIEWPEVVDSWEDLAADMVLHLVNKHYATVLLDMEPKARRVTLAKIGQQLASEARDDYEVFNGNFKYSTGEVRKFLEDGAIEHALEESASGMSNTASDWLAVLADQAGIGREVFGTRVAIEPFDIRASFPVLDEHHRKILVRRFVYLEELNGADRMRVSRAVDALTHLMNRAWRKEFSEHNGPGSRPSLSNQEAVNKSRSNE